MPRFARTFLLAPRESARGAVRFIENKNFGRIPKGALGSAISAARSAPGTPRLTYRYGATAEYLLSEAVCSPLFVFSCKPRRGCFIVAPYVSAGYRIHSVLRPERALQSGRIPLRKPYRLRLVGLPQTQGVTSFCPGLR